MKKFVCSVCGYVHEGEAAPAQCPQCKVPAEKFVEQSGPKSWAAEHIVGVAQGNSAWLFGGITTPAAGHYAAPVSDTDEFTTDTWVKLMK